MTVPRRIFAVRSAAIFLVIGLLLDFARPAVSQSTPGSASFEMLASDAASARDAGHADEAIRNYRAALQLRPDWEEGWWYLGTILYDGDHFEEAIPALRRVLELDPKVGPARAFLGLCEFETGDYADSYTDLQSAKELGFSESPEVEKVALYHLGLLLNTHGEFEHATELLAGTFGPRHYTDQIQTALGLALLRAPILPAQIDPSKDALIQESGEVAGLLANHDTEASLRLLEQMLRDYPDTPYLHYRYGEALLAASRYQAAEAPLREEIRVTPRSPLPWIALAKALRLQGKHSEEAAASQQAQQLAKQAASPDASQANQYALNAGTTKAKANAVGSGPESRSDHSFDDAVRLAQSAQRAGRMEEAVTQYQEALKIRPSWPEGWRQLGTIQYMNGRYAEAITALQQSVAKEAKQADTWTLLGLSEFETKDYKNALVHLERGRALGFSGNVAAVRLSRYHLALLLNRNGDFDRAIDALIPAIGAGALSDEIQFAMGMALLRIPLLPEEVKPEDHALVQKAGEAGVFLSESRYDQALPIFEKIVNAYPKVPFLHYAYGDALAATSMYEEAQSQLQEEAKISPTSPLPYLRLATIGLQRRQSPEALAAAKKAVGLAPESSEAHYLLGRSLLEDGDTTAAIHELEAARQISPNSPKVRFNLARAYSKANRTADAQQERAEFERFNAQLPRQSGSYGDRTARGTAQETTPLPAMN